MAISSQTLSGTIAGQPWTFVTGETCGVATAGVDFCVYAYSESFTPCNGSEPLGANLLQLDLPREVGSYSPTILVLSHVDIASNSGDIFPTSETIVIDAVTATTVSGGINFDAGPDNSVNGQFQATLCP